MRELVEYMAKSLVNHPETVRVEESGGQRSIVFRLHVHPDDMGRVIGKNGRVANAMRTMLKIAATKEGKRAILEIVDGKNPSG